MTPIRSFLFLVAFASAVHAQTLSVAAPLTCNGLMSCALTEDAALAMSIDPAGGLAAGLNGLAIAPGAVTGAMLESTGVVPGTYVYPAAMAVDANGRVTSAVNGRFPGQFGNNEIPSLGAIVALGTNADTPLTGPIVMPAKQGAVIFTGRFVETSGLGNSIVPKAYTFDWAVPVGVGGVPGSLAPNATGMVQAYKEIPQVAVGGTSVGGTTVKVQFGNGVNPSSGVSMWGTTLSSLMAKLSSTYALNDTVTFYFNDNGQGAFTHFAVALVGQYVLATN